MKDANGKFNITHILFSKDMLFIIRLWLKSCLGESLEKVGINDISFKIISMGKSDRSEMGIT